MPICVYERTNERGEMGIGRMGVTFLKEGTEWRFPGLLYADKLVLCFKVEEENQEQWLTFC